MITFNYISLLILLFSLLQNLLEIYKSNYLFSILYSSTILIFLLIKKYKKIYKISTSIIIYTAIIIPNIYLFFYKNIKESQEGQPDINIHKANAEITVHNGYSDVKEEPDKMDEGCPQANGEEEENEQREDGGEDVVEKGVGGDAKFENCAEAPVDEEETDLLVQGAEPLEQGPGGKIV